MTSAFVGSISPPTKVTARRPPPLDARQLAQLARGEPVEFVRSAGDAARTLYTLAPAAAGDRGERGAIEIAVSLAGHDAYVWSTVVRLTLAGIAILAINLVLSVLLGRYWIGRPIRQVITKARLVGRGQLEGQLKIRTRDEVGDLAREVNMMATQLAAQQDSVEASHREQLAAQEQLRHSERLATVGKLAAGIAHEMGTPLNVADGYAKQILSGAVKGEEAGDCARIISKQITRITAMIRGLMRFARRQTPKKGPVDLVQLAHDTVMLMKPLEKNGVVTTVEGTPTMALADASEIQQVLTNLITNGMQAMPKGGSIVIRVHAEKRRPPAHEGGAEEEYSCITVEDQGAGIAAAELSHIFDPFFTTKDVGEGTGLGLSMAHGIVRDHGGWIDVASQVGEGCRFTVYLPRAAS